MCRGFDPLFSLWQDRARSFWGIFSHPPTPKRSFGVLKLPILKEFDLLGPKFHFSLDLFGSNFQRPAAHPHQFSDQVPPPGDLWQDTDPVFFGIRKRQLKKSLVFGRNIGSIALLDKSLFTAVCKSWGVSLVLKEMGVRVNGGCVNLFS